MNNASFLKRMFTKENALFGGLQFLLLSSLCAILSFIVMYFEYIGVDSGTIGIILAVSAIVNIFVQTFLGYLSDYVVPVRKILIVCTIATLALSAALPFLNNLFWVFTILYLLSCVTERPFVALTDSFVTKRAATSGTLNYGVARAAGSIGFALSALLVGKLISSFGHDSIFYYHTFVLLLQLVLLFVLPDVKVAEKKKGSKETSFFTSAKKLFKIPQFTIFLLAGTIAFIGIFGVHTFLPTLVQTAGGDSTYVGMMFFTNAMIEVPLFFSYGYVSKLMSSKKLITLGLALFLIKHIVVAAFFSRQGIFFGQIIMGFGYSIFLASGIAYIQSIVPKELTSTAIALFVSGFNGISAVLGTTLAGFVIDEFGVIVVNVLAGGCCVVGILLMLAEGFFKGKL